MSDYLPKHIQKTRHTPVFVADSLIDASFGGHNPSTRKELSFTDIFSILARRWIYIAACIILCSAIAYVIARRQTPIYSASTTIRVNLNHTVSPDIFDAMMGNAAYRTIETQVAVLKLPSIQGEAISRLGLGAGDLEGFSTDVNQVKDSNLITVKVEHSKPESAQEIANMIAKVYLERTRNNNQSLVSRTRKFLEGELNDKWAQLSNKQRQLERAKRTYGIADIESMLQKQGGEMDSLEASWNDAKVQERVAARQLTALNNQLIGAEREMVASVMTSINPLIPQLRSQLANLETQRAAALNEYLPDQPEVLLLDGQINDVRGQLKREAETTVVSGRQTIPNPLRQELLLDATRKRVEVSSLNARVSALHNAVAAHRQKIRDLPQKERVVTTLASDIKQLRESYDKLNERYDQIRMDEEAKLADGQLLEPARKPGSPIRPQRRMMVLAGAIMGLLLGIFLTAIREGTDTSLRDPSDIENRMGLPILASVPHIPSLASPFFKANRKKGMMSNAIEEGSRLMQMAVSYHPNASIKTVMLTSPQENAGKTTLSRKLGESLARSGMKVIIVDADYRRFGLTREFGALGKPGLTNHQTGELDKLLLQTDIPNLKIMPTGPIPKDPAAFIQSDVFSSLITKLQEKADIVVFDAPPLSVTDGLFLSRLIDGVILVVIPGETPTAKIERSVELLHRLQVNIIGICLNKVQKYNITSYYSSHKYSYDDNYRMKKIVKVDPLVEFSNGSNSQEIISRNGKS